MKSKKQTVSVKSTKQEKSVGSLSYRLGFLLFNLIKWVPFANSVFSFRLWSTAISSFLSARVSLTFSSPWYKRKVSDYLSRIFSRVSWQSQEELREKAQLGRSSFFFFLGMKVRQEREGSRPRLSFWPRRFRIWLKLFPIKRWRSGSLLPPKGKIKSGYSFFSSLPGEVLLRVWSSRKGPRMDWSSGLYCI